MSTTAQRLDSLPVCMVHVCVACTQVYCATMTIRLQSKSVQAEISELDALEADREGDQEIRQLAWQERRALQEKVKPQPTPSPPEADKVISCNNSGLQLGRQDLGRCSVSCLVSSKRKGPDEKLPGKAGYGDPGVELKVPLSMVSLPVLAQ